VNKRSAALAATGVAVCAYVALNPQRRHLDSQMRAAIGGAYAGPAGMITHYAVEGPSEGATVVLIHGGTVPMFTWDAIVPELAAAGYRTVRYDMLGRGYSDRPRAVYDRNLYQRQLEDLLDRLEIGGAFDLVGFSLGGATAVNYAARHPELIRSLTLISPVAVGFRVPTVFRIPGLGEVLLRFVGHRILERRARDLLGDSPDADDAFARFAEQKRYRGFEAALLSMFRSDALGDYRPAYAAIGHHSYPVMLLWGMADPEITAPVVATIRRLVPRIEYRPVEDVGHGVVFQRSADIVEHTVSFLDRSS
jgi:pimeloyl-ACP methyl ester carboxylesterase